MTTAGNEHGVAGVIPAYNREMYIGVAITSALSQTLRPDEVIVVVDGSTDRTAEVASSFGPPVRLIQIENTGVGPSRPGNVGAAAARSPSITLLDSDDLLLPEYASKTMAMFSEHQGLGMVFCKSLISSRLGPHSRTEPVPRSGNALLERALAGQPIRDSYVISSELAYSTFCRGNFIGTATGTSVPRQVWDDVGGFEDSGNTKTGNDLDFMFRVASRYPLGVINESLTIYFRHYDNISNANLRGDFREHVYLNLQRVFERQLAVAVKHADRRQLRERISESLLEMGYRYRRGRQYGKAMRCYARSLGWAANWRAVPALMKLPVAWALSAVLGEPL